MRAGKDYFLADRSLGQFVFLMSLFGTNMTAFTILGSSGHAFINGIVTHGLVASSSGLVIPLTIFLIGTRVWAPGKKFAFTTPVLLLLDRSAPLWLGRAPGGGNDGSVGSCPWCPWCRSPACSWSWSLLTPKPGPPTIARWFPAA